MKNRIHEKLKIFEYIVSTNQYKVIYILLVCIAIFGRLQILNGLTFPTAILQPFGVPLFHYSVILMFSYGTITICKIFDDEFDQVFIRYKSKKKKLNVIIHNVIAMTVYNLAIYFILYFFLVLFTYSSGSISAIPYDLSGIIYIVYFIFKISIIMISFQVLNTILYFIIKEKIFLVIFLYFIPMYLKLFYTIKKIYISFPWLHQLVLTWNSFGADVISLIICITFINVLISVIYKLYFRRA